MNVTFWSACSRWVQALLDEAGETSGDYYREQFPETLETAARAVADLLALVYPAIDNLHEQQGRTIPSRYRAPVSRVPVPIGK